MRILTSHWMKPIPDRSFDWEATTEDYDGADHGDPIGYGRTEAEAVADLREQLPLA